MYQTIVIGAGISGLTAAFRLKQAGHDVLLLEAADRTGGVIRTKSVDGFLLEQGPNSVRMTDDLEALARDVGLDEELITGDPRAPRYIYHGGKLVRAPMGPASLVTTPLVSFFGKLRVLGEPFIGRPRDAAEPSIREFVTRRLGREIHDVIVSAFVSGIYAGDTSRLSAEAVWPKLVEMEREHGGLVRGGLAMFRARKKTAAPEPATTPAAEPRKRRRGMTIASFKTGLARLPERIGESLGESLMLETPVEAIEREGDTLVMRTPTGRFEARDVILATDAATAAALLGPHSARAAELLESIEYPPLASVTLAYSRDDVTHSCEGFGFLAPRGAGLRILGSIFPTGLFPERAPTGWHSFTCFIGGATDPGAVELDDEDLVAQVAEDLEQTVGATGEPKVLSITRWRRAIPQYTIGHTARVAEIEREAATIGVRMLGNYLHGVSVGDCVAAATKMAKSES